MIFALVLPQRRISVQGFICVDNVADIGDAMAELTEGYKAGKIKVKEDIQVAGIESYTNVVRRLYAGENTGKLMLKIAEE
jgi:NADPH-dependent curcumin reductase